VIPLERTHSPESVAAFVVTFRRPLLLRANLRAIVSQTRKPDAVIIINNDPENGVYRLIADEFADVGVVNLAENLGSGGGFARALHIVSECGYAWGWLLDDDSIPEPETLGRLLAVATSMKREGRAIGMAAPVQVSSRGRFGGALWRERVVPAPAVQRNGEQPFPIDLAYWAGLLVHRSVVARIGYPRTDFFRCYADYEYCLRLRRAAMEIVAVPQSRVSHHEGLYQTMVKWGRPSVRRRYSPSRYYYDARNAAFTASHTMRSPLAVVFHLARQVRLAIGDLLYEDQKTGRLALRVRGTVDGLRGRLGRREDLEWAER